MILRTQSENRKYWYWLLAALALHAALFFGFNAKLYQPPRVDFSSGENTSEVSLETLEEPPSPSVTPLPIPTSLPASQRTPLPLPVETPVSLKADDIVVPKATPTPPSSPQHPVSKLTQSPKNTLSASGHSKIKHAKEHHENSPEGRQGSSGNGKASYLENPEPPYPEEARDAQIEGRVELMVNVNESGSVTAVRLVKSSGDPSLDQSALHTVRTLWKFHPARTAGIPVSSEVLVPITFRLSGSSPAD